MRMHFSQGVEYIMETVGMRYLSKAPITEAAQMDSEINVKPTLSEKFQFSSPEGNFRQNYIFSSRNLDFGGNDILGGEGRIMMLKFPTSCIVQYKPHSGLGH